ncbi:MAG: acyl-CoA synthetase [Pseudomonadota bacterium]
MLTQADDYRSLRKTFSWDLPARYNIAVDVCDKWATSDPSRLALLHIDSKGVLEHWTFQMLARSSNRLANLLSDQGIGQGDRIGILLPQGPATALAHLATYKLGAIAVPLFCLFGPDALAYRLGNAGARALITDQSGLEKIDHVRAHLTSLELILSCDGPASGAIDMAQGMQSARDLFHPVDTAADDPAVIIYTSGTTGPPKGALHAHRVLLGHLPGVEMPHEFFPQNGDLFWTPADWAWIGGLFDVLLPAWHHGIPVLSHRFAKFDPEKAFHLMGEQGVRNMFMPPTALKMMRQVSRPRERFNCRLRSLGSGGESLGSDTLAWAQEAFGLTVNEFYGQTECNLVLSNCAGLMPVAPGSMGRPVPGHDVAIINDKGQVCSSGETGTIAIRRPDPVMFLGYWQNPEATREKFIGDWLITGDKGWRDESDYFYFLARDDDLISSGGYRIGPAEVENCLIKHPAVALAAVIGVPDALRGQRIKAFLVLEKGHQGDQALREAIQDFVRTQLAAHEYPREIAFVAELPMTATGKIMRRQLRDTSPDPD